MLPFFLKYGLFFRKEIGFVKIGKKVFTAALILIGTKTISKITLIWQWQWKWQWKTFSAKIMYNVINI